LRNCTNPASWKERLIRIEKEQKGENHFLSQRPQGTQSGIRFKYHPKNGFFPLSVYSAASSEAGEKKAFAFHFELCILNFAFLH
jgi:hypothetical protein